MIRSSVDFPQPDGPISETNSPVPMSRSMSWRAVTPVRNAFVTPWIETTLLAAAAVTRGSPAPGAGRAARSPPRGRTTRAEQGADDVRRPEEGPLERVVLVEVDDRAPEAD